MATRNPRGFAITADPRRPQILPSGVLGMIIFIFTEVMFFAGLISAFAITRSSAPIWPPPGQPRLPVEETAVNTAALLLSGVVLYAARRAFSRKRLERGRALLLSSVLLGSFFVVFQGFEWLALLDEGLTVTSSSLGSFFYLIVGVHALHAVVALGLLATAGMRLRRSPFDARRLAVAEIFWYFVVGVWPALYVMVYMG